MRRFIEQLFVDTTELAALFVESLLWGLPMALFEIGAAFRPYLFELVVLGGLVCLLIW